MSPLRALSGVLAASILSSACYDHSITQAIIARRRAAKAAEGAKIERAQPAGPHRAIQHTGSVKLYVSEEYRKQHGNWKAQLLDLIDDANMVLVPQFATRLVVSETIAWSPRCNPAQANDCLDELSTLDGGAPGTWVVGVLGSVPQFTTSFDDLGRAYVGGRHIVLRDVSDLSERAQLEQAFPAMLPGRREEILRRRKHHKRTAAFLHEWGHSMGAEHVSDRAAFLFASYDDDMSSFGDESVSVIAAALADRFSGGAEEPDDGQPQLAKAEEREAPREQAKWLAASTSQQLSALSSDDQRSYAKAELLAKDNAAAEAYRVLEPLVARYPQEYNVQHLACGLLMQLGRMSEVQSVCSRVQTLSAKM